jgi:TonB-dependent SusC/RagA subfamily outer membrane receptor
MSHFTRISRIAPFCSAVAVAACVSVPVAQTGACDGDASGACAVVGYATVPRHSLTSAVSSFIVNDQDRSGVSRLEDLIEGHFAGVTVDRLANGDYSLHIRGSIGGADGGEPLVVVDGLVPSPNVSARIVLASVAPGAVMRIDVLRDAGSASAYGSRGAHGVILITTRR